MLRTARQTSHPNRGRQWAVVAIAAVVAGVASAWAGAYFKWAIGAHDESLDYMALFVAFLVALAAGLSVAFFAWALLTSHRTARDGSVVIICAMTAGLAVGSAFGSEYRFGTSVAGHVRVQLTGRIEATWSGSGTCTTVDNGTAIAWVKARGLSLDAGTGQLSEADLRLAPSVGLWIWGADAVTGPRAPYGEASDAGYPTPVARWSTERDTDGYKGTVAFSGLPNADWSLDPGERPSVDGRIEWACTRS